MLDPLRPIMRPLTTMAVLLLVGPGCRKQDSPEPPESPTRPAAAALTAENRATVEAQLAQADALDGTTDKLVSKCAICAFRMAGSSEHRAELAGYTLHFCSASCKTFFEADPVAKLLAVQIESP